MKSLITAFTLVLLACSFCAAQVQSEKLSGFDWLKQFEGDWEVVSSSKGSSTDQKATVKSRAIGANWIVNEHSAPEMNFEAIQTIGYDKKAKQFTGSWVDSMMKHKWTYRGTLDPTGKKLLLDTEGPDYTNMSVMKKYRDVYEFKSKDEIAAQSQMANDEGKLETFMTSTLTRKKDTKAMRKTSVLPFLMFIEKAEEAIDFYKTVFPDLEVESVNKYKAGDAQKEGTIKTAVFVIAGQRIMCTDSPDVHDFEFTPSFSFFVECENEDQLKTRFEKLSKDGKVMMPLNNYGFSQKFGWTSDKFGVSWQLNLK